MERPPVVELGQRIELGHGIRLVQLERGLEREARSVDDVLERRDVLLAEPAVGCARQDGEHPRIRLLAKKRDGEPRADRLAAGRCLGLAVERDLQRPRAAVVGDAHASDLRDLGLGQPDRRENRLALRIGDHGHGRVDPHALSCELEQAHHAVLGNRGHVPFGGDRLLLMVELDAGEAVVQRLRELGEPVVVTAQQRDHDLLLATEHPPDCDEEQADAQQCKSDGQGVDRNRHVVVGDPKLSDSRP